MMLICVDMDNYNQQIINYLLKFITNNPEMRFIQVLWALGVVDNSDRFYEESNTTLEKVKRIYNNPK